MAISSTVIAALSLSVGVSFAQLCPRGGNAFGRVVGETAEGQNQLLLPVGEAIIDAGLARYEASVANDSCRGVLLAAEARARASALGLWADPYYAVIATGDRDSLAEKAGSPR